MTWDAQCGISLALPGKGPKPNVFGIQRPLSRSVMFHLRVHSRAVAATLHGLGGKKSVTLLAPMG
eukprot:CAMPEP_0179011294 /NCGR_PEP_ID=MMETSP0796-20121207/589_1 /TAXON_ID=73915 /ORGANISM="Pyrodinium bahamense, Strain pbaha01" /LENGTH=64 /DNA_ID=CAMNT_0020706667 /DNA_START=447 /DNA_END=637 /DNA_ORIENTATION=-